MTPLVDLGFLLITFFIFTTTMSKPTVTKLFMPANGDSTKSKESVSLTVLLNDNGIYYYQGKWQEAMKSNEVYRSNFNVTTGIGKIIREKQKMLGERKDELMLLIKPLENSSYNNLMNVLDEVMINKIKRYAIVEVTDSEKDFVRITKN